MPDNPLIFSYNYRSWKALDGGSFYDEFYSNTDDVNLNGVSIDESLSILVNLVKSTIDEVYPLRLAGKLMQKPCLNNQLKLVIQDKNRQY